jgi:hypothetical protein
MPKPRLRALLLSGTLAILACGGGEESGDPDGSLGSSGSAPSRPAAEDPAGQPTPMDTGAWVVETPPGATQPSPHPWVAGQSRGGTQGRGAATLLAVRSARQDGFDRVVFEFDTHVPQWRADYVDSPQHECGSGEEVRVEGDGWLQLDFESTNAHTEEGRATNAPRHVADPAGANLRELRRTCDFEAQVQYVIGVGSPNRYRAFQLTSPARLVVDIEQ